MITQQVQIKINLSFALKDFVESRATKFGMPLAGYIKHLILNDVKASEYPVFPISERSEKKLQEALRQKDKAVSATDFFTQLHES